MSTFEGFPKIPRFNRNVIITEKIDGTNACVIIEEKAHPGDGGPTAPGGNLLAVVPSLGISSVGNVDPEYHVYAQSRTRLIRPGADNYGFAAWVRENAAELMELLGPGRHFGEWYGAGIQRRYGLDHKRFALFNVGRWSPEDFAETDLPVEVVPILAQHSHPATGWIENVADRLRLYGSRAVPGFMQPEGIVLYHTAAKQTFKILLEGDDVPKGNAA